MHSATTRFVHATETRIAVFARAPEPGRAKTRLMPLLGAGGAARLQEMMIERTLATACAAACGPVELWCDPSPAHPRLMRRIQDHGIEGLAQGDGDLGARMLHAAAATLSSARRVIIIGTDCPALTPQHLQAASAALDTHDAVLTPAEDGGYVLLGLNWWDPRLFLNIEWGTALVLPATRTRLLTMGWRWHEVPTLWDVDHPSDFERLLASGLMPEAAAAAPRRTQGEPPNDRTV